MPGAARNADGLPSTGRDRGRPRRDRSRRTNYPIGRIDPELRQIRHGVSSMRGTSVGRRSKGHFDPLIGLDGSDFTTTSGRFGCTSSGGSLGTQREPTEERPPEAGQPDDEQAASAIQGIAEEIREISEKD